jgi:hypothetical protein
MSDVFGGYLLFTFTVTPASHHSMEQQAVSKTTQHRTDGQISSSAEKAQKTHDKSKKTHCTL